MSAEAVAAAIEELARKMGLPLSLSKAGVTEKHIELLVQKAMTDGCHGCNPRPCTAADMEQLFRAAL